MARRKSIWSDFSAEAQKQMIKNRMDEETEFSKSMKTLAETLLNPYTIGARAKVKSHTYGRGGSKDYTWESADPSEKYGIKRRMVRRANGDYEIQITDPFTRKARTISRTREGRTTTIFDNARGPQDIAKALGISFVSAFGDLPDNPTQAQKGKTYSTQGVPQTTQKPQPVTASTPDGTDKANKAASDTKKDSRRIDFEERFKLATEAGLKRDSSIFSAIMSHGTYAGPGRPVGAVTAEQRAKSIKDEIAARNEAERQGVAYTGGTIDDVRAYAAQYKKDAYEQGNREFDFTIAAYKGGRSKKIFGGQR